MSDIDALIQSVKSIIQSVWSDSRSRSIDGLMMLRIYFIGHGLRRFVHFVQAIHEYIPHSKGKCTTENSPLNQMQFTDYLIIDYCLFDM